MEVGVKVSGMMTWKQDVQKSIQTMNIINPFLQLNINNKYKTEISCQKNEVNIMPLSMRAQD